MSRLWVPEERKGTGEPILDLWEQKSGHLRSRPILLWGEAVGGEPFCFRRCASQGRFSYLVDVEYEWIVGS